MPLEEARAVGFREGASPPSAEWVRERLEGRLGEPRRDALLRDVLGAAEALYTPARA